MIEELPALAGPGSRAGSVSIGGRETSYDDKESGFAPETAGLLIRHQPSYDEVANIAAFAASDWARTITASEINLTGGAVID